VSDGVSSDEEEDRQDEEDDDENTAHSKLSEDDEPGWVMGMILKTVPHRMVSIWQKQTRLDELTQPAMGDAANYTPERDMKYQMSKLIVLAIVKPQTDMTAATPLPTTSGDHMQSLDSIPEQSHMS